MASKKTLGIKSAVFALIDSQLVAAGHFVKPDRFGHYKTADGKLRLKVQATSIRFERKSGDTWFNLKSTYFAKFGQADIDYILRRVKAD
jgi:hypothetical protein